MADFWEKSRSNNECIRVKSFTNAFRLAVVHLVIYFISQDVNIKVTVESGFYLQYLLHVCGNYSVVEKSARRCACFIDYCSRLCTCGYRQYLCECLVSYPAFTSQTPAESCSRLAGHHQFSFSYSPANTFSEMIHSILKYKPTKFFLGFTAFFCCNALIAEAIGTNFFL